MSLFDASKAAFASNMPSVAGLFAGSGQKFANAVKGAWGAASSMQKATAIGAGVGTIAGGIYGGMTNTGILAGMAAGGKMGALTPFAAKGRGPNAMTARGAVLGGLVGGVGYDSPITGMLAGAAVGRYGGAAFRGAKLNSGRMLGGAGARAGAWTNPSGRAVAGAGRGAFFQASRDARRAYGYIGKGINKAYNSFKGLYST